MTELTRRQMRELERAGKHVKTSTIFGKPIASAEPVQSPDFQIEQPVLTQITSRRQLRESASAFQSDVIQAKVTELEPTLKSTEQHDLSDQPGPTSYQKPEALVPRRLGPLPLVGSRRELTGQVVEQPAGPVNLEPIEVEIPEEGFKGSNYLAEPSTQSIMLEIVPEAIALPIETGEVFTTGSIAILPDAPGPSTGGIDGPELDLTDEAVTGVLSIVDPVPARSLIDDRSPLGVVPDGVLKKGWWRPWVVGLVSLFMALAAILASITILNALGE